MKRILRAGLYFALIAGAPSLVFFLIKMKTVAKDLNFWMLLSGFLVGMAIWALKGRGSKLLDVLAGAVWAVLVFPLAWLLLMIWNFSVFTSGGQGHMPLSDVFQGALLTGTPLYVQLVTFMLIIGGLAGYVRGRWEFKQIKVH